LAVSRVLRCDWSGGYASRKQFLRTVNCHKASTRYLPFAWF